jgi:hypothetical protein
VKGTVNLTTLGRAFALTVPPSHWEKPRIGLPAAGERHRKNRAEAIQLLATVSWQMLMPLSNNSASTIRRVLSKQMHRHFPFRLAGNFYRDHPLFVQE